VIRGDKAGSASQDGTVSWTVIVPVKRLEAAKSRLRGAVPGVDHEALVLAMALDSLAAALASPAVGRVIVVGGDPALARAAVELGAEAVPDLPDAGLNPAVAYAATLVRPGGTGSAVAALPADLPAMRADDLTAALLAATATPRAFVADAARTGTVLLAARPGAELEPCFGGDSAAAHAAGGAVALAGGWPSLRRDVDTAADLVDAVRLGLGPRTLALIGPTLLAGALHADAPHTAAPLTETSHTGGLLTDALHTGAPLAEERQAG
jgi:2-phospho-L-lactate guanylyltransferase